MPNSGINVDKNANDTINSPQSTEKNKLAHAQINEAYTADYYIKQLPKTQAEIDSISKERNFADYQLGIITKKSSRNMHWLATN